MSSVRRIVGGCSIATPHWWLLCRTRGADAPPDAPKVYDLLPRGWPPGLEIHIARHEPAYLDDAPGAAEVLDLLSDVPRGQRVAGPAGAPDGELWFELATAGSHLLGVAYDGAELRRRELDPAAAALAGRRLPEVGGVGTHRLGVWLWDLRSAADEAELDRARWWEADE